MELEKIEANGLKDTYALTVVRKEFRTAVDEPWTEMPPWKRYQRQLLEDLAVLEQEKEAAIDLQNFEKLKNTNSLYCITRPKTKKNVRIIYTIFEGNIILLHAFLEKNDGDYPRAIKTAKKRLKNLEND